MGIPGAIDDIRPFAELSQNATTVVYKAYQSSLERFVLLKRLRAEYSSDDDLSARFQEEARIAARVQHRNVVSVFAYGSDVEGAYIVAEFVEGLDLRALIDRGRIPAHVAIYILLEAAKGLKAAHDKDILHRDLKPSNILISHEGEVKLTDFGLASFAGGNEDIPPEIRGTLAYLAPEQILGDPVDHRSDLFSLGATFFEMLTGRRAFAGSDSKEILDAVLNRDAEKFLRATPGVTPAVEAIAAQLLARNPNERYGSVREFIRALDSYREEAPLRLGRQDLKAFLTDPESIEVTVPAIAGESVLSAETEVSVVPDRAPRVGSNGEGQDGREESRSRQQRARRLARSAGAVVAFLFFATAVVFAGVEILSGSSTITRNQLAGDFVAGRSNVDSVAAGAFGILPGDSLNPRADSIAQAPGAEDRSFASSTSAELETEGAPASGVLAIRVDPWAGVLVGEDSLGTARSTEALYAELPSGSHEVMLTNPDFPRLPREFQVREGDTTSVTVSLWSLVGRLDLHVSPWANVYVDGRFVGQTPLGAPIILLPGVRQLRLENPQLGVARTYTVTVSRGDVLEREYILTDIL